MKTLTKSNGLKKLIKVNGSNSKSSKAYQIVSELLGGSQRTYAINGNEIRPCYTSGSGRFTSNQDHTSAVISLLSKIGIEFELINDAPRKSPTGNKIVIKTKLK